VTIVGIFANLTGAAAAAPTYVKYYVVASGYAGQPENLSEIAARFLGSAARGDEVFNLNVGVVQPDGGMGRRRGGCALRPRTYRQTDARVAAASDTGATPVEGAQHTDRLRRDVSSRFGC
jgi:hypothetical protein